MTKELMTEISVTVKDENCRITENDTHYGPLDISPQSEPINQLILQATSKFAIEGDKEAPSIIVKTKTVWQ